MLLWHFLCSLSLYFWSGIFKSHIFSKGLKVHLLPAIYNWIFCDLHINFHQDFLECVSHVLSTQQLCSTSMYILRQPFRFTFHASIVFTRWCLGDVGNFWPMVYQSQDLVILIIKKKKVRPIAYYIVRQNSASEMSKGISSLMYAFFRMSVTR